MSVPAVPYDEVLAAALTSGEEVARFLREELPYCWRDRYLLMSHRPTDIITFTYETFEYIFDTYQQQVLAIKRDLSDDLVNSDAVERLRIDFVTACLANGENNVCRADLKKSLILFEAAKFLRNKIFFTTSLGLTSDSSALATASRKGSAS